MESIAHYAVPNAESIMYLTGYPSEINPSDLMDTTGMHRTCSVTPQLNPDLAL